MAKSRKNRRPSVKSKLLREVMELNKRKANVATSALHRQLECDRHWFESHPDCDSCYRLPLMDEFMDDVALVLVLLIAEGLRLRLWLPPGAQMTHPATAIATTAQSVSDWMAAQNVRYIKANPSEQIAEFKQSIHANRQLKAGVVRLG